MIISKNSLLRHPPVKILPQQVVIFSSITFSVDVCEVSYKDLIKELKLFGEQTDKSNNNEELIVSKIFLYTWNIINHLNILTNTIISLLNISFQDPLINKLNSVKEMRNSYQHIDERISEVLSIEDIPTYGSISWNHNLDENNYKKHILYSGIFTHQNKAGGTTFPNTFSAEISDIYFITTVKKGKKQNLNFIQETVHIDELMIELKKCIRHIEEQINDQIPKKNILETHKSNLSFSIDAFKR